MKRQARRPAKEPAADTGEDTGADRSGDARNGRVLPAEAARRAAEQIVALTGRELESVVSIERRDEGWLIGVEVVETRRIPDSADILAVFEAEVDEHGDLYGYRRTARHSRGQLHRGGR
ncbi:gas vesicle protein [Pseudonocardia kujensis]|uniref:gas vesicle protein GvpO n=1 Tax=Pseudonocardia kujensis TaxID=1128675 RepID=UPI001E482A20|nr:gas vesicle protein GvpO [Pseudonocardia kujensis]MCE0763875.1 gas vesicle protein [Pseudonocardia kujensis]